MPSPLKLWPSCPFTLRFYALKPLTHKKPRMNTKFPNISFIIWSVVKREPVWSYGHWFILLWLKFNVYLTREKKTSEEKIWIEIVDHTMLTPKKNEMKRKKDRKLAQQCLSGPVSHQLLLVEGHFFLNVNAQAYTQIHKPIRLIFISSVAGKASATISSIKNFFFWFPGIFHI